MPDVLSPPLAAALTDDHALSQRLAEWPEAPAWLVEAKQAAWARHRSLPMPTRGDEAWRFSNVKARTLDDWTLPAAEAQPELAGLLERLSALPHAAGRAVFVDDHLVAWTPPSPELAARGVVFAPLADALAQDTGVLRDRLLQEPEIGLGSAKFEALNFALARNGIVLLVPADVEIEHPFLVSYVSLQPGTATFPRTVFVAGANSQSELVERFVSADESSPAFVCSQATVVAEAGSRTRHVLIQEENTATVSCHLQNSSADRDAELKTFVFQLGAAVTRYENHAHLNGPGANLEMSALALAAGNQEFDARTFQSHHAPHTRSDLLFKHVLLDEARTIFAGLIRVDEDAQRTDAYQSNRNLLLDPRAETNSLPGLEILANDVRCTHGSTTGQLDPEQLFYLKARGLRPAVAQRLLTLGFLEEIVARLDDEELTELLHAAVETKFA